jgi:AAA ATPase domain/Histidine kinase-, DNA gyrase B-, and HSP90-like ATPase
MNGEVGRSGAGPLQFPRSPVARGARHQGLVGAVSNRDSKSGLLGRRPECRALDRLLDGAQAGQSRVLVLRGESGVGKSALLGYLVRSASGCRVTRAAGVESEMELPYAGLHQLCAPVLNLRERLPVPQRDALAAAFGLSAGPAPDRLCLGLSVLGLLCEVAGRQPLLCVVDDVQWLDQASAQIISFGARRLLAERVALVCATRTPVVRVTVRDSGVGIDPQSMSKLLDAFYTTKSDGMGIGLSVSQSIIDRHRGRLWGEPNDGPGATFAFSLPSGPATATIRVLT